MLIRVEPKEWMMSSVFLYFDQNTPSPEDEVVRKYIAENSLVPKREGATTWNDREWDVMYFGGCYLGRHLGAIDRIQKEAAEKAAIS